jgi:hypothetical protein
MRPQQWIQLTFVHCIKQNVLYTYYMYYIAHISKIHKTQFNSWATSEVTNLWVMQDQGNKSTHVRLTMTMLPKVWMPYLVSTMSIHQWKELNVVERSACNCFHPMWKSTSCAMATKMLWIASWVLVCLLPWAQCKRWIPMVSIGCVHTYQGMLTIEGWGNPSHVRNVVKRKWEDNQKARRLVEL